jgi:hypothetical protein
MFLAAVQVCHLVLAAIWTGSMIYSLIVVQPKVAAFFTDDEEREVFLAALADGNRWKVVAMAGALTVFGALVVAGTASTPVRVGYGAALVLYLAAVAVFVEVSWRHWPARVFALAHERAGFRQALKRRAWTMAALVGTGFVVTLAVSVVSAGRR